MNFEKPNLPYRSEKIKIKAKPKGLKEKIKQNVRKIALAGGLGAGAIAGGIHINEARYPDYSQMATFNEAFKKARKDKKGGFRWKGNYFTTNLVNKELSDNYHESKKFLEDYYVHKLGKNHEQVREIIDKLNDPTYLSLTSQKGDRGSDGSYEYVQNKLFIFSKDGKGSEAIAVHELDHKIARIPGVIIYDEKFDEMLDVSIKDLKNSVDFINFINKYGVHGDIASGSIPDAEGTIRYLSDKHEIHARQTATRFWLSKHFSEYKIDAVFTKEHYDYLKNNYEKLPYQIQQLMDIFHKEKDFIYIMQNY